MMPAPSAPSTLQAVWGVSTSEASMRVAASKVELEEYSPVAIVGILKMHNSMTLFEGVMPTQQWSRVKRGLMHETVKVLGSITTIIRGGRTCLRE